MILYMFVKKDCEEIKHYRYLDNYEFSCVVCMYVNCVLICVRYMHMI